MPRHKTPANQGPAEATDDSSSCSGAPSLSELIAQAAENETPADLSRAVLNRLASIEDRLARIEAAATGNAGGKTADEEVKKGTGGRPLDVYIGALVDLMAANAGAFGDAVADRVPAITRAADRRAVERFLPPFAEAIDARLIERIKERNQEHFVYERPRLPKNLRHTLADAMRRWNKKQPPGK